MKKKILRFFGLLDDFNTSILKRNYWRYKLLKYKKGFDVRETWSLDFYLAKLISPRLKEFKKQATNCGSLPGNILEMFKKGYKLNRFGAIANKRDSKRQWEKAKKFWENKIQDMIDAFQRREHQACHRCSRVLWVYVPRGEYRALLRGLYFYRSQRSRRSYRRGDAWDHGAWRL